MWKQSEVDMDSETLIEDVWPLGTDGPETQAAAALDLGIGGGAEWDVPLVGADIVDVWTPQQFLDECPPILGCEEHLTMGQGEMAPDESQPIQLLDAVSPQCLSTAQEIHPLYAALKEWKDEVANDLLESFFECGGAIDPLEDIDLDEFFSDLNSTNKSIQHRSPLPPAPPPPPRDEADEKTREALPSPAPSYDSGVSSASSSSSACGAAAAPECLSFIVGENHLENGGYVTIDPAALQLMHVDFVGAEETTMALGQEWTTISMDLAQLTPVDEDVVEEEEEGEEEDEGRDQDEEDEEDSLQGMISSAPSPVYHFHSYAQQPIEVTEGEKGKGKGRRKRPAKTEATMELKKTKKKEQNKTAAQRYRMKKKMEKGSVFMEEQEEEKRNKELKAKVDALEKEISYLKDLMAEVKRQRR